VSDVRTLDPSVKTADISQGAGLARKVTRHEARDLLRKLNSTPTSVSRCGIGVVSEGGAQLRLSAGPSGGAVAGWAGVGTCGKVWLCPVCASKILNRRTEEIQQALEVWLRQGCDAGEALWRVPRSVGFLTLTMRHDRGHSLKALWDGLLKAWRDLGKSYAWKKMRADLWIDGLIRTVEVTHGENGWHVHLHVILLLKKVPGDRRARRASVRVFAEWAKVLQAVGFDAFDAAQNFKVMHDLEATINELGEYVAKAQYGGDKARGLALEVTRSDIKGAEKGGRPPFEILRNILENLDGDTGEIRTVDGDGLVTDLALWHEWVLGSKGRRQHFWQAGLRDRLALEAVLTDDEAAAVEVGSVDDAVAQVTSSAYLRLQYRSIGSGVRFLVEVAAAYDSGGRAAVARVVQRTFGQDALMTVGYVYALTGESAA